MYILTLLLLIPVALWIVYDFVIGFIQGFREGMQRPRWRKLKGAWRLCKIANRRQNL